MIFLMLNGECFFFGEMTTRYNGHRLKIFSNEYRRKTTIGQDILLVGQPKFSLTSDVLLVAFTAYNGLLEVIDFEK